MDKTCKNCRYRAAVKRGIFSCKDILFCTKKKPGKRIGEGSGLNRQDVFAGRLGDGGGGSRATFLCLVCEKLLPDCWAK